ncbi:hypothetical protein BH10BDE1_BH10BDE1_34870 [soil metagenome]
MEARTSVFDNGPFELLHKIVEAYSNESGADRRARVTVHTSGSKSWTGVPVQFVNNRSGEFFIFSLQEKTNALALASHQIVAVEIENVQALETFLEKPWTNDTDFSVVSRLQAVRDLAALWSDYKPTANINFESFPSSDEAPGFVIMWMKRLRSELENIRREFGDKELSEVRKVEVKYAAGPMTCVKSFDGLEFTIDLSTESLNRKTMATLLSAAL